MSAKVLSYQNQTQLDASLALKAPIAYPAFTGYASLSGYNPFFTIYGTGGNGVLGVAYTTGDLSSNSTVGDVVLKTSNSRKLILQAGNDNAYQAGIVLDYPNNSMTTWARMYANSSLTVSGDFLTTGQMYVANVANFNSYVANFGNEIRSTSTNNGNVANIRLTHSSNSTILRQDDNFFYFMSTNSGNQYGNYNALRPFTITNSTGDVAMGSNVKIGQSSSAALPARFAVASGNSGSGNISAWTSNWSIFGGDGTASSSSLGLGNDGSSSWVLSLAPGVAWKNLNARAASHNWYDSADVTPFLSGSAAGVVLNTGLSMGSNNITSAAGIYALNITAQGALNGTSLSVNDFISGKTLSLYTAGVDQAGNITGTSLTLTGSVTCVNVRSSGAISTSGLLSSQSLAVAGGSAGIDASGNITGASVTVSGTVNAVTVNAQFLNVSTLVWEGDTNITGSLSASANISGLSLNAGNSVLGNVSALLLRASGNVSALSLNAGASVLGAVTAASLNVTGNFTAASLFLSGNISATSLSASGNVSALSLNAGASVLGNVTAALLSASGNVTALSLNAGNSVLGNVSAASLSASGNVTANSLYVSNSLSGPGMLIGSMGSLNISGGATVQSLALTSSLFGCDSLGNVSGASLSVSGNVSAALLIASGNVSALSLNAGNSVLGNVSAALLNVTGNVTALSLNAGNSVLGNVSAALLNVTGNLTALSLNAGNSVLGNVSAASLNVNGGIFLRGNADIQTIGNISCASLTVTNVGASLFNVSANSLFVSDNITAFGVSANNVSCFLLSSNQTNFATLNVTGNSVLGSVTTASLNVTGAFNVQNGATNIISTNIVGGTISALGFFGVAPTLQRGPFIDLQPGASLTDCINKINDILGALRSYGLLNQ